MLQDNHHIYCSSEPGQGQDVLHITHNAGLFSCSTIALREIMMYYNKHGKLPDRVERRLQYAFYKRRATDDLIPMLFNEDMYLPFVADPPIYISDDTREDQFSDYKKLRFDDLRDVVSNYFYPSQQVLDRARQFISDYNIDVENTVAVFHRSNDKHTETQIPSDDDWLNICDISNDKPFLIIPDTVEFAELFKHRYGGVIQIEQNPVMPYNPKSCLFYNLTPDELPEHALNYLATIWIAAQCHTLITHSGNGGLWASIYRGAPDNIIQYLNGEWI